MCCSFHYTTTQIPNTPYKSKSSIPYFADRILPPDKPSKLLPVSAKPLTPFFTLSPTVPLMQRGRFGSVEGVCCGIAAPVAWLFPWRGRGGWWQRCCGWCGGVYMVAPAERTAHWREAAWHGRSRRRAGRRGRRSACCGAANATGVVVAAEVLEERRALSCQAARRRREAPGRWR